LVVAPETRTIELRWAVQPGTPRLSYEAAVASYKAEYARRYETLMHGTGHDAGAKK
jgi:hypothetical protein